MDSEKEQQVEKKVDEEEGQSAEKKRSRSIKSFVAADASESGTVESDDEVETAVIQEMEKPKTASMVKKDDESRSKEEKAASSSSSTNLDRASKVPTRTGSSPSSKDDKPCDGISTANRSVGKEAAPRIRPSESVDDNKTENEQQNVLNDYKKVSLSARSFVADGASESETVQSEEGPSVIQEVAKEDSDNRATAITAVAAVATDDCSDADKKAQPNCDAAFAMPTQREKPEEPTTTGLVESQSKKNEKSNPPATPLPTESTLCSEPEAELQMDQPAPTGNLVGKQSSSVRSFVAEGASESETEKSDDEKEHLVKQMDQPAPTGNLVGKQSSSVRSFVAEDASESVTEESDDDKEHSVKQHSSSSAAAMTDNGTHSAEASLFKPETLNDLADQQHSGWNDDAKQVMTKELHRNSTGNPGQRKQPDGGSSDLESSGSMEENSPDERENAPPLGCNESSSLPDGSQPPVDDDGESSSDLDSPKYGSAPRLDQALELELERLSAGQSLPANELLDENRGGLPEGDGSRGDVDGDEESLKGMLISVSSVNDDHDTGGKSTERLTSDSSRLGASITFDGHYESGKSLEFSSFCVNDLDGVVEEVEKKKKHSKSKSKDKNCAKDWMHHSCPKDLSASKTKQNLSCSVELDERPSHKSLSTGMWQQGMDESSSSTNDSSNNDDETVNPLESSWVGKSLTSFSISVTTRESDNDSSDSDGDSEAKTTKKSLKKGKLRKKNKKSKDWKPQKDDEGEESAVHPDWGAPPQERKGIFGIAGHVHSQSSLESADLNTSQSSRLSVKSPKNGLSPKGLIDKADVTEVSKEFAKQLKSDALSNKDRKAEFFDLLNLDPWSEDLQLNEEKIVDIIKEQPENCCQKYNLEAFQGRIFPLSALCALGASSSTIKSCYEAHKDAILETDAWVGTALHYACAYKSRVEIVEFLVEKESSALREVNQFKRMPLHM